MPFSSTMAQPTVYVHSVTDVVYLLELVLLHSEILFITDVFLYNLFTKSTDKIQQRSYKAPREETREAYGRLAVGCKRQCMVALTVYV
jgi:hypothetical protein